MYVYIYVYELKYTPASRTSESSMSLQFYVWNLFFLQFLWSSGFLTVMSKECAFHGRSFLFLVLRTFVVYFRFQEFGFVASSLRKQKLTRSVACFLGQLRCHGCREVEGDAPCDNMHVKLSSFVEISRINVCFLWYMYTIMCD